MSPWPDGNCVRCGISHDRKTIRGNFKIYCLPCSIEASRERDSIFLAEQKKKKRIRRIRERHMAEKINCPIGFKKQEKTGYILVCVGKNNSQGKVLNIWKLEHRLIYENALGRNLESGEVIHHRNGNKSDNRLENLQLLTTHTHSVGIETKHSEDIHRLLLKIEAMKKSRLSAIEAQIGISEGRKT